MRFFFTSLDLGVTFAFTFLIHFTIGQFDLDTEGDQPKVPKIEHEKTPVREMWFETSKGNNITLSCPKLPGGPPAVIEVHEPLAANSGLERKLIISTSGQLRLHNVTYEDAKTYYCSYFSEAPKMPTAKIHLNVYDVFGYMHLSRSRRALQAGAQAQPQAHKADHSKKGHSSGSHGAHQAHTHESTNTKDSKAAPDHGKTKGKEAGAAPAGDKAKEPEKKKEEVKPEAAAAAAPSPVPSPVAPIHEEEQDANENYDDEVGANADVVEPPSSPDITQLSDTCVQLKWTSGALRDRGVKGYKVEYLQGNASRVFGGIHAWHTVANRVRPKFRIFKVDHLQPETSYRFRIATIYAGNKYIYGLSSGWVKMQRWS